MRFLIEEKSSTKVCEILFHDFNDPLSDPVDLSDCKRYDFYLNRVLLSDKECTEYVAAHIKEMCKYRDVALL